jgi:hypothetical protein
MPAIAEITLSLTLVPAGIGAASLWSPSDQRSAAMHECGCGTAHAFTLLEKCDTATTIIFVLTGGSGSAQCSDPRPAPPTLLILAPARLECSS